MSDPKASKRQKVNVAEDAATQMWEHYRNYLDSLDGDFDDPQGDIDELQEMIDIFKTTKLAKNKSSEVKAQWMSVVDLLPVLISVGYYHLAEAAIAEYLQPGKNSSDRGERIQSLLMDSLESYPKNAATWSMGGNFGRMSQRLSIATARQWYERAAEYAAELRTRALQVLDDETLEDSKLLKEWVELLVLNQVVGVEFEVDDDTEANSNHDEIEDEELDQAADGDDKNDDTEGEGNYSPSTVEGTSRFMCSMLASMEGKHDDVVKHLQRFGFTHRLHPNVWTTTIPSQSTTEVPTKSPLAFCPKEGILPDRLYSGMKQVFDPVAAYWAESNYMGRGYYSYFMDYDPTRNEPRNLIEDVIVNYLLPRAKQVLSTEEADSICGFEWWTHTRPIQANLGHNLHFDTDESLLSQEKNVTHPILSSVLYLTGGSSNGDEDDSHSPGGVTIVLNQTPDSLHVADCCWQGIPKNNSFLLFPGNLLHGVLPCPGRQPLTDDLGGGSDTTPSMLWKNWRSPDTLQEGNRLTFMVGFWTRKVPATMKQRRLYGPCGPLPPSTKEHSWIQEISKGYGEGATNAKRRGAETIPACLLPKVSPAWETIDPLPENGHDDRVLRVPPSIDHRFFVKGAPRCFYDCLFEDDVTCG